MMCKTKLMSLHKSGQKRSKGWRTKTDRSSGCYVCGRHCGYHRMLLGKKLFALIPAALNFVLVIYDCFFSASIGGSSELASVDVSLKIGAYLILLAGIVIVLMSVLGFFLERNK